MELKYPTRGDMPDVSIHRSLRLQAVRRGGENLVCLRTGTGAERFGVKRFSTRGALPAGHAVSKFRLISECRARVLRKRPPCLSKSRQRPRGGVVTQRIANPRTPVQFRTRPPIHLRSGTLAIGQMCRWACWQPHGHGPCRRVTDLHAPGQERLERQQCLHWLRLSSWRREPFSV